MVNPTRPWHQLPSSISYRTRTTLLGHPINQYPDPQAQILQFSKEDGNVDLRKCYEEVQRRAKTIGCQDWWSCSYTRFQALAMDPKQRPTYKSAREAITVLNGEMLGYYKDAKRVDWGHGLDALDFVVKGLLYFYSRMGEKLNSGRELEFMSW